MLYGATGYTGRLVIRAALARGHRPVLAGRNADKLAALARAHDLDFVAVGLDETTALREAVGRVEAVFHCAGPYIETGAPMRAACLAASTSYLDLTGELPCLQDAFEDDKAARAAGIAIVPAVGFDVVPTDCLLRHVSDAVGGATRLDVAIAANARPSAGTAKSALGVLAEGAAIRRDGRIVRVPLASEVRKVRFPSGTRTVVLAPIGDVCTAYVSTGATEIRAWMAQSPATARLMKSMAPLLATALKQPRLRRAAMRWIERRVEGPDDAFAARAGVEIWARAERRGQVRQAWLRTPEAYRLTADVSVRVLERVLAERPVGALAPSQVLPLSALLELDGVELLDALP
ncbi:MAG: NAD-dependent epimerase/dehydratase family protein [Candidatus Dadabacteria bacterium]|nr:MAG: NAD-dependent epimerase/dehydratase family protein [Candidatus Dadabacteria bacterium]